MKLRDANLQVNEKNSFTHPPSCILPSFSQKHTITFSEEALQVCEHNFFQEIWAESSNLPV